MDKRTNTTNIDDSNESLKAIIQKQDATIKSLQQDLDSTKASLTESENILNSIVNSTTDVIWDKPDINEKQEFLSPQWKTLLGYKDNEETPKDFNLLELVHPEDSEKIKKIISESIAKETHFEAECRLKTKSGKYKWFQFKASIYKNAKNKKTRMTGTIIDIHRRKRTELELEESKSFLELTMNQNPDLIFVKDTKFRITNANKAFLAMYPKEMQHKVIGFTTLEDYLEEEAEEIMKIDQSAFDNGYSETTEALSLPNGTSRIFFTQKIKFQNSKGESFILGLGRDVTEREALIAKLTDSNEELEQFAYIASHDLQEPLRMIINFSGLLESEYEDSLDEEAKVYLGFLTNAATRMRTLISDLLEYSKINHEAERFIFTDCNQSIKNALNNLADSIEHTKAEIKLHELPHLQLNPLRMTRLFQNLVGNAIKYTPSDRKPIIEIKAEEHETEWLFSIADNGIGIKDEHLEMIFTPFKRLHTKEDYPGTGIGLAVCSKIVQNFGGRIWVTSKINEGSVFHFTLAKKV